MTRDQFAHAIRAAAAILGDTKVLVIGSQAIHASIDYLLPEAERSIEVDVASLKDDDGSKADLIDGSIGELSMFQETFGYYAQGVTPQTATLPKGWRRRLIPFSNRATNGVTALCLEPHDLWLSKAIAGRPKDREFCQALIDKALVKSSILKRRLKQIENLSPVIQKRVLQWIHD